MNICVHSTLAADAIFGKWQPHRNRSAYKLNGMESIRMETDIDFPIWFGI